MKYFFWVHVHVQLHLSASLEIMYTCISPEELIFSNMTELKFKGIASLSPQLNRRCVVRIVYFYQIAVCTRFQKPECLVYRTCSEDAQNI